MTLSIFLKIARDYVSCQKKKRLNYTSHNYFSGRVSGFCSHMSARVQILYERECLLRVRNDI